MVDTLGLSVYHSMVNYSMDFMAEVGAKINIDIKCSNEFCIRGTYKNMQIRIEPTFVHIEGSLPKFYYGSNLITLSREEPGIIIDKLAAELGLPLREAIVTRVDIAANIEMDNFPKSYFPYLCILNNFDRNIIKGSLYYKQTYCELCFYDKILKVKKHNDPLLTPELLAKNILRYEMRFKRQWLQYHFDRKIKASELYGDRSDVCCELISIWYYKYEAIVKSSIMQPRFEMSKNGLLSWFLKYYSRKQNIIRLIDSCSVKSDRKAAKLKRDVINMLKEFDYVEEDMVGEFNSKMIECTEVY